MFIKNKQNYVPNKEDNYLLDSPTSGQRNPLSNFIGNLLAD